MLVPTRAEEDPLPDVVVAAGRRRFDGLDHQAKPFIAVVDPEGVLSYASPVASRAFGTTPEQAVGRSIFSYVDVVDIERVLVRLAMALRHPDVLLVGTIAFDDGTGVVRSFEVEVANGLTMPEFGGIVISGAEAGRRPGGDRRWPGSTGRTGTASPPRGDFFHPFVVGRRQPVVAGGGATGAPLPVSAPLTPRAGPATPIS